MQKILLLFVACVVLQTAHGAESIFVGQALSNKPIVGVDWVCSKDEKVMCFGGWVSMELTVTRTLGGPPVSGHFPAAFVMDASYTPEALQRFKVFVVKPIENQEKAALLHADYLLIGFARPGGTICLPENPAASGFTTYPVVESSRGEDKSYCFTVEGDGS